MKNLIITTLVIVHFFENSLAWEDPTNERFDSGIKRRRPGILGSIGKSIF